MFIPRFILASASPRRSDLLRAAGFDFDVIPGSADETVYAGESADAYVRRVSAAKAATLLEEARGLPVLAADTVVVVDDLILGKPVDTDDARRMLRLLSGRTHIVMTGVSLSTIEVRTEVEVTTVQFSSLSDEEIGWYVASGEPVDKAGAYAIQGLASRFIRRIDGSYSNVVGLPVELVYRMLTAMHR